MPRRTGSIAARTRDRLELYRMVEERVGGRSPELVPDLVAKAWGSVDLVAGREDWRAGTLAAEATHVVETRGLFETLDEAYRIKWTDRFNRIRWLDVLSVRDVGSLGQKLVIECRETRADGPVT